MTFELTVSPRTPELADFYRAACLVAWVLGLIAGYGLDWWILSKALRLAAFGFGAWYCTANDVPTGRSFISQMRYWIIAIIVIGEIGIGAASNDPCTTEYDGRGTMESCPD